MTNFNSKNEGEFMKTENSDTSNNTKQTNSHTKHMKMMVVCCGLPIVGFLAIAILGISIPSLETILLLVCPIGMIGMMYFMHRDNKNGQKDNSCCQSKELENEPVDGIGLNDASNAQSNQAKKRQPDSLEA